MNFLITVFLFILIIGFLVFIHELGHFLAAKISKIPVKEFAIGFGPIVWSKKINETFYRIRALPLGGFVSLEGEHDTESEKGFRNRPFGVKFFVLIGGIVMNIIAAIFFLAVFLGANNRIFIVPKITDYDFNNVEKQLEYYPISLFDIDSELGWEGLDENDTIIAIEGENLTSVNDLNEFFAQNRGETVEVTLLDVDSLEEIEQEVRVGGLIDSQYVGIEVERILIDSPSADDFDVGEIIVGINNDFFEGREDFFEMLNDIQGEEVTFHLLGENGEIEDRLVSVGMRDEDNGSILGIKTSFVEGINYIALSDTNRLVYFIQYNKNAFAPFSFTYDATIFQVKALSEIFGRSFESGDFNEVGGTVGGPIAVGDMVSSVVELRLFETLIPLTAFISLSLAIFNVLPIPALDGGQIMIAFIEAIRRKKLSDDTIGKINLTGFTFIILLSILIFIKDIRQFDVIGGIIDIIERILGK